MRLKSDKGLLFCTCGCGANLILVAGDRNLRAQHFRIKDSSMEEKCEAVIEGKTSIDSRIVLSSKFGVAVQHNKSESNVYVRKCGTQKPKYIKILYHKYNLQTKESML